MGTYQPDALPVKYAPSYVKVALSGVAAAILAAATYLLTEVAAHVMRQTPLPLETLADALETIFRNTSIFFMAIFAASLVIAAILFCTECDSKKIAHLVRRGIYCKKYGNPFKLREGELLPRVKCNHHGNGRYEVVIAGGAARVENITSAVSAISGILNNEYTRYAVVQMDVSVAYDRVTLWIEDVLADRSLTFHGVKEMQPKEITRLQVQGGINVDLTTSGSMLVAGKTRSGKTTGVIALLLQVLLAGRDGYDSECIIIDPKQAELSRLPHTVTLDEDGEATQILDVLKRFAQSIKKRQKVLNDLSEQRGDAAKWWDAGMHPSFLFVDEYVACRSIFPKKAAKDSDYCLDTFDNLIKRIVTMGASAGCYVIISIAEASVQEGGLPSMLRSAMSTRILFRPTRAEGLLIWDKVKLETMPERVYNPGDAWFSSTDGEHDNVSCVHFPKMDFPIYGELGRLLREYYDD